MPTQIFTVGRVVAVNFVHLPLQGKVTFVDIADEDNAELLYRYCYTSSNFRRFASSLLPETLVVAEGDVKHHKILQPRNADRSTLLVAGKVLRILQAPVEPTNPKEASE